MYEKAFQMLVPSIRVSIVPQCVSPVYEKALPPQINSVGPGELRFECGVKIVQNVAPSVMSVCEKKCKLHKHARTWTILGNQEGEKIEM